MKVHLITRHSPLLETLNQALNKRYEMGLSCVRSPGQRLSELLASAVEGLLILEINVDATVQDLTDVSAVLQQFPRLSVIVLSDEMSRDFVLQAMRIGVRDVLPLPLQMNELDHALARLGDLHSGSQIPTPSKVSAPGRLIALIGCKGGCGTTFLSTNLACLMANEFEVNCAFIDLDLQFGDASFYLADGLNQNSLTDLTQSMDRLDAKLLASCLHPVMPGLNLLAAPADAESALHIQPQSLAKIIELTRQSHDVVVMDMDRSLDAVALKALDLADQIYVVMDELMISVRDAKRLVTLLRSLGYADDKLRLIVNRHRTGTAIGVKDIEAAVGLSVNALIWNHFEQVSEALNLGKPLAQLHPNSPIVQSLRHVAADLLKKPRPRARGWLDRLIPQAA